MSESAEGGAALAWRLLATLEGGSLLLCASALLAYSARRRARPPRRRVREVLVTNTNSALGKEIKSRLESRGCVVSVASDTGGAGAAAGEVDALVVVGEDAGAGADSLDGMANLVSTDVYKNLKVLEELSARVRRGGCVAWACAGAPAATFRAAGRAFDTLLHASLRHVANSIREKHHVMSCPLDSYICECFAFGSALELTRPSIAYFPASTTIRECRAVWVGRRAAAAARVAAALAPDAAPRALSLRNVVYKVTEYVGRWLKIIT